MIIKQFHINLKVLKVKVIFRKKIILTMKVLLIIKKIIISLNNLNTVNLMI